MIQNKKKSKRASYNQLKLNDDLDAQMKKLSKLIPVSRRSAPSYIQLELFLEPQEIDWFNIFDEQDGWFTPVK
jgi:hypothetical protein